MQFIKKELVRCIVISRLYYIILEFITQTHILAQKQCQKQWSSLNRAILKRTLDV
jgi:hypothetical protein